MKKEDLILKAVDGFMKNPFRISETNEEARLLVNLPSYEEGQLAMTEAINKMQNSVEDESWDYGLAFMYALRLINSIKLVLEGKFKKEDFEIHLEQSDLSMKVEEATFFYEQSTFTETPDYGDFANSHYIHGKLDYGNGSTEEISFVIDGDVYNDDVRDRVLSIVKEDDDERIHDNVICDSEISKLSEADIE